MLSDYSEFAVKMARFIRLGGSRQMWLDGYITREAALNMLNDCLEPGDESTRIDDRELLDRSAEEVMAILGIKKGDLSHGSE